MTYEYDFQDIGLNPDQRKMIEFTGGVADIDSISARVKEVVNQRSKDGWEPLYPFSVPLLWFKRIVPPKPKKR